MFRVSEKLIYISIVSKFKKIIMAIIFLNIIIILIPNRSKNIET